MIGKYTFLLLQTRLYASAPPQRKLILGSRKRCQNPPFALEVNNVPSPCTIIKHNLKRNLGYIKMYNQPWTVPRVIVGIVAKYLTKLQGTFFIMISWG